VDFLTIFCDIRHGIFSKNIQSPIPLIKAIANGIILGVLAAALAQIAGNYL
jgi:hypothetical protein